MVLSSLVKETGRLIHREIPEMKYADLDIALMSVRGKVWININVKQTPRILREAFEVTLQLLRLKSDRSGGVQN